MFVIKVRAEGKKQFNFLTSDGGETRLRVHAAQVDDAAKALSIAAEIRDANPDFESMVVDFNTGKTITQAMVDALAEAGEIAADNAEAEAAAAEFDALPQEEKDAMPIVDVFAETERGMAQEEADDATNGTGVESRDERVIMVTCAETAYDGFGTETVEVLPYLPNATSVNQYRSVAILPGALDWQTNRYASGMVSAMTPERFAELIELGIAVPVAAPKGWDESATGATDADPDPKEEPAADSAAPASDGEQPDATPTESPTPAAPPEGSPEAGEVFHATGDTGPAHVVASVETADNFTSVCGKSVALGEPATPKSDICDYCFMGVPAPADEPEAAKPATTRGAARTPAATANVDPQFVEEIDGLHLQTLKLASMIAEAGSRVDGVRLLSNLRVALASVQASLPKASRSRAASTGERAVYIRLAESGAKGATVNGQHFDSMADACRSAANLYPEATAAQSYVTRRAAGQTANARDYLKRDLAAGRIPADAVSFDDELSDESDQAAA